MTTNASTVDYEGIKTRQQATWASGDYTVIGTTLQIVGESLCEAVDVASGQRVLDVAAGKAFENELVVLANQSNTSTDALRIPSEYLEVVAVKAV